MAAHDLTFVPLSEFPQAPTPAIDVMIAGLDSLITRTFAKVQLTRCQFEDEFCDCTAKGVVHHIASERDLCVRHFLAAEREARLG